MAGIRAMLIGVAVAALTAVAVPATAASRAANCPAGSVCVYSGPDGGGNRCIWNEDDADWNDGPRCAWLADTTVRSVRNEGLTPVALHRQRDFAGTRVCVEPDTTVNVVGRFASHRWVDRC
ncbi:peptidase inhibitor family I36 protein [Streptomyces chartreusis]|uniref:peptidase inhibitor family I36 protein n=1 Tax=Streptomyces chartreusis TaxID=1969 RepID=UPI0036519983